MLSRPSFDLGQKWARHARWGAAAIVLAFSPMQMPTAGAESAESQDAKVILKSMADYVSGQPTIAAAFDSTIEAVTPNLQKIQFASSGELTLVRPDKLHLSRKGGYSDVELVFDGKAASVYGKNLNAVAHFDASGTVDQLVDRIRNETSLDIPGADLLSPDAYKLLIADVVDAAHLGQGVIDGVECEHLAFRNQDTDWQLWVEAGPHPIPRQLVITSKVVAGSPQYTILSVSRAGKPMSSRRRMSSPSMLRRPQKTSTFLGCLRSMPKFLKAL
jgi:hypothetical protein